MDKITIGNVKSKPGEIVYGFLEILEHPIGTVERLPIIIAQGKTEGPTFWLTANIHGNEYTGIPVIHNVINGLDLEQLKGTIVAIPSLNPAGSRVIKRYPYYDQKDPNRLFPDGNPFKEKLPVFYEKELSKTVVDMDTEDIHIKSEEVTKIEVEQDKKSDETQLKDPLTLYERDDLFPSVQELIWKRLFEIIKNSADYLIDLHNAFIKSIPFIFLDRVLYNEEKGEEELEKAKKLYSETEEMVKAFGFTVVRESTPNIYIRKKLHRSTSGAALNYLRIPSFTVELGMYLDVEPEVVIAATKGVNNALRWAGLISGKVKKITEVTVVAANEAVRHVGHPRTKKSAIIELKVKKGDFVKKGDVVALARDIFGRPIPDQYEIISELDGFVFMINEGIIRYPNEVILWLASKDIKPMIDKWPKKK
ncbi:MAG: succinylglutamate desuccinylase/aspartoacylase family protein [Candidatus Heimdallarchaeota archaeon]